MTDWFWADKHTGRGIGDATGARKGLGSDEQAEHGRAVALPGVPPYGVLAGQAPGARPGAARPLVPAGNRVAPRPGVPAPVCPGAEDRLNALTATARAVLGADGDRAAAGLAARLRRPPPYPG